jgi:endonuclease-3
VLQYHQIKKSRAWNLALLKRASMVVARRSLRSTQPKVEPVSVKREAQEGNFEQYFSPSNNGKRKRGQVKAETTTPVKKIKSEDDLPDSVAKTIAIVEPTQVASPLKARKLKAYNFGASPFPDFRHPTPEEAKLAHTILRKIHGPRERPDKVVANPNRAGCGDSPSVLDALVRTVLSQNTSDINSSRAKRSMDKVYGGSDNWEAILEGGQDKLEEAIRCGGLSKTKSAVISSILRQTHERYGKYSLDHLFDAKHSNEDAMRELISFQGVGPKTASCVLLFCLARESFAVDTHVHRITGLIGWRPAKANRDETHAHLEVRIPDEDKYGLHVLLVSHGKKCEECKAGGRSAGKCELRKAFK